MRYRFSPITLSILASLACSSGLLAFQPQTRIWLDYATLERDKIHNKELVVDDCITEITYEESYSGTCCPVLRNGVLFSKDLVEDFNFRPGASLGVEFMPAPEMTYQISGLYMTEWKGRKKRCVAASPSFSPSTTSVTPTIS